MNIWQSLAFSSVGVGEQFLSNWSHRIKSEGLDLTYRSARSTNVFVLAGKRLAIQTIEDELNKLIPKFIRKTEHGLLDTVRKQQEANYSVLIKNQETQMKKYGSIHPTGGHPIVARDKYGDAVPDALILYYETDTEFAVENVEYRKTANGGVTKIAHSDKIKTMFHIDLSPKVSMNSTKNIVQTTVQGRDFSRKELVSGGDLKFTVHGTIVSDEEGIYPATAVKRWKQIMQYNGIVNVNFFMLNELNINQVLIQDYSLGDVTYKNEQPYSFTCVAVEPDEDVVVTQDTIAKINKEIELGDTNGWYKLILNKKLAGIIGGAVGGAIIDTAKTHTAQSFDKLTDLVTNL